MRSRDRLSSTRRRSSNDLLSRRRPPGGRSAPSQRERTHAPKTGRTLAPAWTTFFETLGKAPPLDAEALGEIAIPTG